MTPFATGTAKKLPCGCHETFAGEGAVAASLDLANSPGRVLTLASVSSPTFHTATLPSHEEDTEGRKGGFTIFLKSVDLLWL